MAKFVKNGLEARQGIINGINVLANTVKSTLGPNGKYVIIDKNYGSPIITNDGVTVAKAIEFNDHLMNIGAKIIKEASEKTDFNVGDGTTTAALLTQSLINECEKNISLGRNPFMIKRGMEFAKEKIFENIQKIKKEIKGDNDLLSIATISSKDEKIGNDILKLIKKIGSEGKATIELGNKFETEVEIIEGMHFDEGYAAPFMVTDKKLLIAEYKNTNVLIYEGKISDVREIIEILEECLKDNENLVIMANEFSEEFLGTVLINSLQTGLKILAIKNPGFGDERKEILSDIAIYLGTKVYDNSKKLNEVKLKDLGWAKTIKTTKNQTIILEGKGNKKDINQRVEELKFQLSINENETLKNRIAKLTSGIGVIKVGGSTESEQNTKKYRYEDALSATQAALKNGIVEGGGIALIKSSRNLEVKKLNDDEKLGVEIVKKALEEPFKQIINNSGLNGEFYFEKLKEINFEKGFDSNKKEWVDMFKSGIIDPTNVVLNSLFNAISIASQISIVDSVIYEKLPQNDENKNYE